MKINLKVRMKNPIFWMTMIPAVATFVYTMLGLFGIVPTISEEVLVNGLSAIVTALTTLGVLIDPTTNGVSDHVDVMSFTEPK